MNGSRMGAKKPAASCAAGAVQQNQRRLPVGRRRPKASSQSGNAVRNYEQRSRNTSGCPTAYRRRFCRLSLQASSFSRLQVLRVKNLTLPPLIPTLGI